MSHPSLDRQHQSTNSSVLVQSAPIGKDQPVFIYSFVDGRDKLLRTHLVTGEQSSIRVPSYQFKHFCCWSPLADGSLLITGGRRARASGEVVRIDVLREFAVSEQPPMLTPRYAHTCVCHAKLLYVLGGISNDSLKACERYVWAEMRWEALPPLPEAVSYGSAVVLEENLYVLGGVHEGVVADLIQKLRLCELTWERMELRLPQTGLWVACFKVRDTEVYLVVKSVLYSFTPGQVPPLKTLHEDILSKFGPSYYSQGTLYCSSGEGMPARLVIGSLN
jgi:hypothetical protein